MTNAELAPQELETLIAHELGTGLNTIQWVISGYLLTLALPLSGWLVDHIGARNLYLWCFTAFTLSSGLCGQSWSAGSHGPGV